MNIRKFVGATSRDALRLVREALGPDAVVLSNRTMEDGSVEIVALADSDLAAITPKAPRGSAGAPLAAPMNAMAGQQPALAAPRANPMMQANPYASGMPDVFSSVFGASPEAGAENMTPNVVGTVNAASGAAAKSAAVPAAPKATLPNAPKAAVAAPAAASLPHAVNAEQPSARAAVTRLTEDIRADLLKAAEAQAPRTMAESNPWLIDHARRIAAEQQQQGAYSARPAAMTPAAAMAAVEAGQQASKPAAQQVTDTPEWAREGAQLAARRAAQKVAASMPAADDARSPASVAEAIKTRMEQVVNDTVMSELSSMRGMMEEHFAGLLWGDRQRRSPARAALTKHLFAAGFSAQLVQMMVDNLPDDVDNMEGGMEWVRSVLESNLPVMEDEDALMERGGVFALMGPTGVGKTTTTAKLAARCV
ncbi:MAG: flagellar biosynthesis protein FlhF, partial [Paraburkholderia nemoris]